jgi:hypothetical protein
LIEASVPPGASGTRRPAIDEETELTIGIPPIR